MGYAISIGAGLLAGIGLLIWALRERSKRHKAETAAIKLEAARDRDAIEARQVTARLAAMQRALAEARVATKHLRGIVEATRGRLMTVRDPKTVGAWLDEELRDNDV